MPDVNYYKIFSRIHTTVFGKKQYSVTGKSLIFSKITMHGLKKEPIKAVVSRKISFRANSLLADFS